MYFLILIIASISAFIFLRYTPPLFDTFAIIQINKGTDREMSSLMIQTNMESMLDANLNNLVELIRSPEFKKRTLRKLPLNINYYSEGTFLNYEQYTSNPYFVELKDVKSFFQSIPIYVKFIDEKTYVLTYNIDKEKIIDTLKVNKWNDIKGCKIYLNVSNYQKIEEYQRFLTGKSFYFISYDDNGALSANFSSIEVKIADEAASIIMLEYWGQNPVKAADILNTLIQDFLDYNVEKKQEKANKILQFIDDQLKLEYKFLDEAENNLSTFKKTNKRINEV